MKDLITVIIPAYNCDKYIEECLLSVCNQTYDNIEIILVDDGSVDNTSKICSHFANVDSRIKYIYQSNKGVSSARNVGLKFAKGKYITFVDSDDIISSQYIYTLYKDLIDYNCDLVITNWTHNINNLNKSYNKKTILQTEDAFVLYFGKRLIDGNVYGKLYKKELISNLYFDEKIAIGEDQLFVIKALCNANAIIFDKVFLYYYRISNNSAMNSPIDKRYFDNIYRAQWIKNSLGKLYPSLTDLFNKEEICIYLNTITMYIKHPTLEGQAVVSKAMAILQTCKIIPSLRYFKAKEFVRYILIKYFYKR